MKKRFYTLLLTLSTLSLLVGCGEKIPTAEELVNGAFNMDENKALDMDCDLIVDMETNIEEEGQSISMRVGLKSKFNSQFDNDTNKIDGNVIVDIFGMSIEEDLKIYTQYKENEKITYTYDSEYEAWTAKTEPVNEENFVLSVNEINANAFDSLKLHKVSKSDKFYTVSGTIDFDTFNEKFSMDLMSMLDDTENMGSDLKMNVTMLFDKKTKIIKSMNFIADISTFNEDDISLNELSFNIIFNQIGGKLKVEVPNEVIDAASENKTEYYDFDLDFENTEIIYDEKYIGINEEDAFVFNEQKNTELNIDNTNQTELSNNWTDMEFIFDGVKYQLPNSYSDLKANGWILDLTNSGYEDNYMLNPGDKTYDIISLKNSQYDEKFICQVGFINNDNVTKDITECDLWAFNVDLCYGSTPCNNYPEMQIAKGIIFGNSHNDVISAFGEADEIIKSDTFHYTVYKYNLDSIYHLEIVVYDNYGVCAISLNIS